MSLGFDATVASDVIFRDDLVAVVRHRKQCGFAPDCRKFCSRPTFGRFSDRGVRQCIFLSQPPRGL